MADVAQNADEETAPKNRTGCTASFFAENSSETDYSKCNNIIEQDNRDNRHPCKPVSAECINSQKLLNNTVNQRGSETDSGSVAVCDDKDRQHRRRGDRTAVRQLIQLDKRKNGCKRDHNGALDKHLHPVRTFCSTHN